MSGPLRPYQSKSSLNLYFKTTVSSRFAKRPKYDKNLHQQVLFSFPSTTRKLNMRSFLPIDVNLYRHKDGDVVNIRKFEYFNDYFRH